jgi:hypothetical protein
MAVCRLIAPFASMSGKVSAPSQPSTTSAVVTLPDKYGRTLVRRFVNPNQPNSEVQQESRTFFGSVSEAYQSLSQPQVEEWQALADSIEKSGRLGLDYNLSWTTLFQQVNNYRLRTDVAITLDPPQVNYVNPPGAITAVYSDDGSPTQAVRVVWSLIGGLTTGCFFAIRLTRDLGSPNRQARANELRYPAQDDEMIYSIPAVNTTEYSFTATRLNVLAGQRIGVEIKVLNPSYVLVGRVFNTNILVQAEP